MTARYSIVPSYAFADPRLTPADVRVLGALGAFLSKDKNNAWPRQREIAAGASVDRSTANRSLKRLVAFGYVQAQARGTGMKRSLAYRVDMHYDPEANALSEQPELFDFADSRPQNSAAMTDVANSHIAEAGQAKSAAKPDVRNPHIANADVTSGGHNRCDEGGHIKELLNRTPSVPFSKENGVEASSKKPEADQADEPPPVATKDDLRKQLIFGTGRTMLVAQGMQDATARAFLGRLVKQSSTKIVARAIGRACDEAPGDLRAWLSAAVTHAAKRAGIAAADVPDRDDAEAERIANLDRRMAMIGSGKIRVWAANWGPDPREDDRRVPAELYEKHRIPRPQPLQRAQA